MATFPRTAIAQNARPDERSWRPPHLVLAGAFTLALWIDAAQTRAAMGRGYREINPLLGAHPSVGRINTYTLATNMTVLGAAAVVPTRLRAWVLGAALLLETATVARTVHEGIAMRLPW